MADLIITLDGPAASGKSSVARGVADALELPFVSSGLFYRAATFLALEAQVDAEQESAILELLNNHEVVLKALAIEPNRVLIDGEDITAALHTDDVDAGVSAVARHPAVRDWVQRQLQLVEGSFVVEGRDMGAVVFPAADYKFYLHAPAEVRARRRVSERSAELDDVKRALERRDQRDAKQLKPAEDAVHIETSQLDQAEVIQVVLAHIEKFSPAASL